MGAAKTGGNKKSPTNREGRQTGDICRLEYEKVLKKEYPDQILNEYKDEVSKMVVHTSERKNYAHMVSLLRKMQQMKGAKLVEQIVADKSHQDALLNGTLDYDKLVAEYGIIILCRYGENICTL